MLAVRRWIPLPAALALVLLAGCSGDEIQGPPEDPAEGTLTLDADGWVYASLESEGAVTVADPRSSSDWDIAFNALDVMLNGGAAGPGNVTGYCLCQNAGATNEQIIAMTADGELADFEAVTADDIPAAAAFESDELVPAAAGWFTGTGAAAVAAPETVWLVRLANGTSFAKVHVTNITGASADHAGQVTIEYAVQATSDAAFGATETAVLDASTGTAIDLATGNTGTDDWDLKVDGFTITLNGGVSGTGEAAAYTTDEAFAGVTTASVDARAYQTDEFAGVFASHAWYKYNLLGNHFIHPTFDVYLLKRGDTVYKVQITSYYDAAGDARHITLRYAQLTD